MEINNDERKSIAVYILEDKKDLATSLVKTVFLKYGDSQQGQDAESLAVSPVTHDLYILTKDYFSDPRLYTISRQQLMKVPQGQVGWLRFVRTLKMSHLGFSSFQAPTDMSFSPDGKKLMILSYGEASEVLWEDVLSGRQEIFHNFVKLSAKKDSFFQTEAISYKTTNTFYYMSEYEKIKFHKKKALMYSLLCL